MSEHKYTDEEVIKGIGTIKTNDGDSLKEICDFMAEHSLESYAMCIRIERAEAIKEFAEKLKRRLIEGGIYPVFVKNQINDLVKELTEEKK